MIDNFTALELQFWRILLSAPFLDETKHEKQETVQAVGKLNLILWYSLYCGKSVDRPWPNSREIWYNVV